jgi:hypothetical protein
LFYSTIQICLYSVHKAKQYQLTLSDVYVVYEPILALALGDR